MQAKDVWKQDPEANIWAQEGYNGEWRRLHNEELHSLYRSPNIVRVIKSRILSWAGHLARMEEGMSAFKIVTGKHTGKRPSGRHGRRWEDNIRMDLKKWGANTRNLVDSAQGRNNGRALMNAQWTSGFHKPGSYCIVLYCIVLKGWSLLPNALRPFQDLLCSPEFRYY